MIARKPVRVVRKFVGAAPLGAHGGACAESGRREISPGKTRFDRRKNDRRESVDENAEKPGARPGFSLVQSGNADQKV
jgi:hypothetical protein